MYDSLNRHMLEPYGCDWVHTPNFQRLSRHAVTFDNNYAGSLPCMPARRELHTGRYNFLHRSWGPIEPFDDSMPEILKNNGIYTHLVSDHYHYWEDGGATYHSRYSSWDCIRGQEGDTWKTSPALVSSQYDDSYSSRLIKHNNANRDYMDCEEKMSQVQTFAGGLEFLNKNWEYDNWFLQIEAFDPHEPFYTQESYKALYPHSYDGSIGDWPPYYFVTEGDKAVEHMRKEYAALMTMCDTYLGKVLDFMDAHDMWKDTMLIVNTDHGFLLGEHGWWSKSIMPDYNEIAHTPLFIWDPRSAVQGERRQALTQAIDLPATLLDFFHISLPKDMQGKPLAGVIKADTPVRKYALFGMHETHLNITDGRWVYMRAPLPGTESLRKDYTLMPVHKSDFFAPAELQQAELVPAFSFTKGCPVLCVPAAPFYSDPVNYGSRLYDLQQDPGQLHPLENFPQEAVLATALTKLLDDTDCPGNVYKRFGLVKGCRVTEEEIHAFREQENNLQVPDYLSGYQWTRGGWNAFRALLHFVPEEKIRCFCSDLPSDTIFDEELIFELTRQTTSAESRDGILFNVRLNSRCD